MGAIKGKKSKDKYRLRRRRAHTHTASEKLLRDYRATRLLSDREQVYRNYPAELPRCSYIPLIAARAVATK